jgi:glycosyltransferase involved in cell wall biosynthesis
MKVLFHTHVLNFRGTAVAVYDYAKYNEEVLGNESIICYNTDFPIEDKTEEGAVDYFQQRFEVVSHHGDDGQLRDHSNKVDVSYFIKYGYNNEFLPEGRTAIHAVFQANDPHGTHYAYVSEWLANKMNNGSTYVPHMVDLPRPNKDIRETLGIAKDKIVVGRLGGFNTFDLPFVKEAVKNILETDDRFLFLFANTKQFIDHPNVLHLSPFFSRQTKSNYINGCDLMLHARQRGESFGLSVAEFLSQNKPVLSWEGGEDQNHTLMLKDSGLLYNEYNVEEMIRSIKDLDTQEWSKRVEQFKPEPVMKRFNEVFFG